jgi:hypothetical protein
MTSFDVIAAAWNSARRGALSIWTVYDSPSDFPGLYVARRFEMDGEGQPVAMEKCSSADLGVVRDALRGAGLTRIGREPDDDAKIVESWL